MQSKGIRASRRVPVAPFCVLGAMAAAESEYVSANFATLQGEEKQLRFPRRAILGALFCTHRSRKKIESRDSEIPTGLSEIQTDKPD